MSKQYLIGEFSEITGISKRMLRHYDQKNILKPFIIDDENGYRYYNDDQIVKLDQIQFLRDLGFTLSRIEEILTSTLDYTEFITLLRDKEADLSVEVDAKKYSLMKVQRLINDLENYSPGRVKRLAIELLNWESGKIMKNNIKVNEKYKNLTLKTLMNGELFLERIEQVLSRDTNNDYHFITFDIDNFISVNDKDGYTVGDEVILTFFKLILNNLEGLLDKDDTSNMISRMGGDECAVFLKDCNNEEVLKLVDKTIKDVAHFDFNSIGCTANLTTSCGIVKGKKPEHIAKFRHESTRALLDAKRDGKNQYKVIEY